jgi:hypothetical protein
MQARTVGGLPGHRPGLHQKNAQIGQGAGISLPVNISPARHAVRILSNPAHFLPRH